LIELNEVAAPIELEVGDVFRKLVRSIIFCKVKKIYITSEKEIIRDMNRYLKISSWILFGLLCIGIGLYPLMYLLTSENIGLLQQKAEILLSSPLWNTAFYMHIILGGMALLSGWTQFSSKIRTKYLSAHQILGKIYVLSVLLSGLAGFYLGLKATGGIIAKLGFSSLAVVWLSTTYMAYQSIKKKQVDRHEIWMTFSFAACFAAVMLRLWLVPLTMIFGDFIPAYRIVAWLCWVPNIVVAYLITRPKIKRLSYT
jgi:hypothetical protein